MVGANPLRGGCYPPNSEELPGNKRILVEGPSTVAFIARLYLLCKKEPSVEMVYFLAPFFPSVLFELSAFTGSKTGPN
jgi:hypothetical protein